MISHFPITYEDLRNTARQRLPQFLFDYIDGGAGAEYTLAANVAAWAQIGLRQRVLVDVGQVDTGIELFGQRWTQPLALAPIGLAGAIPCRRSGSVASRKLRPLRLRRAGSSCIGCAIVAWCVPCWIGRRRRVATP